MAIRRVLGFLTWPTVPLWLGPLAWWLAYQPWAAVSWAGMLLLAAESLFVLVALVAVAVALGAPPAALLRVDRRGILRAWGQAVVFLAAFVGGLVLGRVVWRDQVERFAARSQPLVAAIDAFTADHRRPPETLDELQPQYLAAVPTTGIGAFPEYRYHVVRPAGDGDNPWELHAIPPSRPMGFDVLMYYPRQNYPARNSTGSIERVGTWGYFHD